jgi:hypothetical protein
LFSLDAIAAPEAAMARAVARAIFANIFDLQAALTHSLQDGAF